MKNKTTNTGPPTWLGTTALAGLLVLGVPLASAEAQETRQDTSAVRQDTSSQTAAADTVRTDSTLWGQPTDQEADVKNPPGYRGMERPVNVFPADTSDTTSAGMERPADTEITTDQQTQWQALLEAARNQPNPTPELRDAIKKLRKQSRDAEPQPAKKAGTKKKDKTTKKQTTEQSSQTDRDSASAVRVGQDTTGDTTRYEVNAEEGRSATGTTGETSRDSADVIHRQRETPPGVGYDPPPYPADSEQVWVEQQPSGDSVPVGFDSTANNQ